MIKKSQRLTNASKNVPKIVYLANANPLNLLNVIWNVLLSRYVLFLSDFQAQSVQSVDIAAKFLKHSDLDAPGTFSQNIFECDEGSKSRFEKLINGGTAAHLAEDTVSK